MRDLLKAFRPASFRGVSFQVDTEATDGGRRVAISPIAYSDTHITEDMGGAVARFTLTAYVVGDAFDAAARSLSAALNAPGPATLVLPMGGPQLVRVPHWSLQRELMRAGYVGFDIEFVSAGRASTPFAAVPARELVARLIASAVGLVSQAVSTANRDVKPGQGDGASLAVVADRLETVARASGLPASTASDVAASIATVRAAAASADPTPVAAQCAGLVAEAAAAIARDGDPIQAGPALHAALADVAVDPVALASAASFAAAWLLALTSADYGSQQDARRARDLISPTVDPVLDVLATGLDATVHQWLSEVAAVAAQSLSDIAANRAPLVRIETGISAPATLLAYQLYADAGRAAELTVRNAVATPALMPVSFEAISP